MDYPVYFYIFRFFVINDRYNGLVGVEVVILEVLNKVTELRENKFIGTKIYEEDFICIKVSRNAELDFMTYALRSLLCLKFHYL